MKTTTKLIAAVALLAAATGGARAAVDQNDNLKAKTLCLDDATVSTDLDDKTVDTKALESAVLDALEKALKNASVDYKKTSYCDADWVHIDIETAGTTSPAFLIQTKVNDENVGGYSTLTYWSTFVFGSTDNTGKALSTYLIGEARKQIDTLVKAWTKAN